MNLIIISAIWGVVMMFSGIFISRKTSSSFIAIIGAVILLIANTLELN